MRDIASIRLEHRSRCNLSQQAAELEARIIAEPILIVCINENILASVWSIRQEQLDMLPGCILSGNWTDRECLAYAERRFLTLAAHVLAGCCYFLSGLMLMVYMPPVGSLLRNRAVRENLSSLKLKNFP